LIDSLILEIVGYYNIWIYTDTKCAFSINCGLMGYEAASV